VTGQVLTADDARPRLTRSKGDEHGSQRDMMAARLPYLDPRAGPARRPGGVRQHEEARGRVLNTFRLMAHHARSVAPRRRVVRSCARARSTSSCASRLREGLTDQWLQLLSDAQRALGRGTGVRRRNSLPGRLHDNPLFSDLERLVIRYARGDDREGPVDSRLVEELKKQLDRKPSCSSRSASRPPTSRPLQRGARTELET